MTVKSFDQHNLATLLDAPASQAGASSPWVQPFADGRGADRAVFMLISGANTEEITLDLWQAVDAAGTDTKVIPGATAVVDAGGTGEIVTIEIGPGALDNVPQSPTPDDGNSDFTYVQGVVTIDGGGSEIWTLVYIQHNLRYPGYYSQDATYSSQVRVYD